MNAAQDTHERGNHFLVPWFVGLAAALLAGLSALPYPGGWNDGGRLAAVESIADRQTFAIDDSTFCHPPAEALTSACPPYDPRQPELFQSGTRDKMYINGHFYSDKPAVISVLMAGIYEAGKWLGQPAAAERPDIFCRVLTITTSGLAYVLAVLAMYSLGARLGLPLRMRLLWLASFALATVSLTYTRQVNSHIMLLAVVASACLLAVQLRERITRPRVVGLGLLGGLAYNLDLGAGPPLLAALGLLVLYRTRSWGMAAVFLAMALPWVAGFHYFNYAIGGGWKPISMVPEYADWPGSPFSAANLTGFANHGPWDQVVYSLALLFGRRGIFNHNLPLLLCVPCVAVGLRRASRYRVELAFMLCWCVAAWLSYAVLSNNQGGACCSVRWFVPFLGPGYFLLAVALRQCPRYVPDFFVLSAWGGILSALMWPEGPWRLRMVPLLWPIVGAALISWFICWRWRNRLSADRATIVKSVRPLAA